MELGGVEQRALETAKRAHKDIVSIVVVDPNRNRAACCRPTGAANRWRVGTIAWPLLVDPPTALAKIVDPPSEQENRYVIWDGGHGKRVINAGNRGEGSDGEREKRGTQSGDRRGGGFGDGEGQFSMLRGNLPRDFPRDRDEGRSPMASGHGCGVILW